MEKNIIMTAPLLAIEVQCKYTDKINIEYNCPFCLDAGYDLYGLKWHILYDCENLSNLEE